MKRFKTILLVTIGSLLIVAAAPVNDTYTLSNDYTVTISGTSNMHGWNEKVGTVSGSGTISRNNDGSFDLDAITIAMDVYSIKSGEGSVMDNKTYKALKAESHPKIVFTLTTPIKSIALASAGNTLSAKGDLTIAGVTKPVDMQVKVSIGGSGKLAFRGSQSIKMTDYGVDPPTALFGMLKTGDEITINFATNFISSIKTEAIN